METIRERSEALEHRVLSDRASFSDQSRGRARPQEKCPLRTEYQRDRDRIIHCASFRRLKHKTQVFLAPERDHYRTRLTHTLEVAQIARTIARALRLNEDLTEAIALGHDLGHTPFGHAGERALDRCLDGGFRHFEQSVRVAERLEKNGNGLNLTWEVRNGIVCHTRGAKAATLEGQIVRYADKIAYMNHDIDDAIRGGVLREEDIPVSLREHLGTSKSRRINTMVQAVIDGSDEQVEMRPEILTYFDELHTFLFESVYKNPLAKGEEGKAESLIESLYGYYSDRPEQLPEEYRSVWEKEGAPRAAADYIAGMTDRYAVYVYESLFVPKSWGI